MTSTDRTTLAVRSPADLIAAVPFLLGFHPADSVVVVALRGKRVVFAARADLPEPGDRAGADTAAGYLADVIGLQRADAALVLGYGPAERVTPVIDTVGTAVDLAGLCVLDLLRITDGRYWSYCCTDPGCCPPDGVPFDPSASEVTATAVFAGQVALPDRTALAALVAPVEAAARDAMRQATERAEDRLVTLLDTAPAGDLLGGRAVRDAGAAAVRAALDPTRDPAGLSDDEVAWLSLLLRHIPVRDHAWEHTDGEERHLALWTDVLRRADPELAAAPGCLLAFAAWRCGQGALAVVALERALAAQPDYSMALLLDDVLRRGVQPSALGAWPKPPAPGPRRRRSRRRRQRRGSG
ncbi:DUF4192 domain-containing protein [Micromonospora zhanjiangensis]|uniref:DUF4192 domain-containing protein n=1 Tax=Micromonospora zhanjiangensis TaxID=1522057 RepID=A0ABV8KKD9_9ACTN